MTTKTSEETAVDYSGEGFQLSRTFGDTWHAGMVGFDVHVPAQHVHPKFREACERARTAQAARDELAAEVAARAGQRAQLVQQLAQETDRKAAGQQLREFDSESELLTALLPEADDRLRGTWDNLVGVLRGVDAEWTQHLCQKAPGVLAAFEGAVQTLAAAAAELQLIEHMRHRDGIIRPAQATPETFERTGRQNELDALVNRLREMPALYRRALTPPETTPQPGPEPEPDIRDFLEPGTADEWQTVRRATARGSDRLHHRLKTRRPSPGSVQGRGSSAKTVPAPSRLPRDLLQQVCNPILPEIFSFQAMLESLHVQSHSTTTPRATRASCRSR